MLAVITPLSLVAAFSGSAPRALIAGLGLALALVALWLLLGLVWVALAQLLLAALASGWLQWRALKDKKPQQPEGQA